MLAVLVLALAQIATPPAAASASETQTQNPPAQQVAAQPVVDPAHVVHCRYIVPTGSHIPSRVCTTPAQDQHRTDQDQDRLQHLEQQSNFLTQDQGRH
ncbi:MAG: hypothetical protein ABUL42_02765 [Terricaulis silvestris]